MVRTSFFSGSVSFCLAQVNSGFMLLVTSSLGYSDNQEHSNTIRLKRDFSSTADSVLLSAILSVRYALQPAAVGSSI